MASLNCWSCLGYPWFSSIRDEDDVNDDEEYNDQHETEVFQIDEGATLLALIFRSSTIFREIAILGMDANLQLSYKGRVDKNTEKHCQ